MIKQEKKYPNLVYSTKSWNFNLLYFERLIISAQTAHRWERILPWAVLSIRQKSDGRRAPLALPPVVMWSQASALSLSLVSSSSSVEQTHASHFTAGEGCCLQRAFAQGCPLHGSLGYFWLMRHTRFQKALSSYMPSLHGVLCFFRWDRPLIVPSRLDLPLNHMMNIIFGVILWSRKKFRR